jgi:ribosome silencing factor RsfS/YbeB/iojap
VPPKPEFDPIAKKTPSPPAPPAPPTGDAPARGGKPAAPPRRRAAPRLVAGTALPAPPGTPRKKAVVAGPGLGAAARPRAAAKAAAKTEPSRLDQLQRVIVGSLEDDKAEAIVTLDLAGRAAFADRMVIATGLADRQITAMATHLEEKLHEAGLPRVQIEGAAGSDWVLIDAGDIVIHLFKPDARDMYGLEKMWGVELDEGPGLEGIVTSV